MIVVTGESLVDLVPSGDDRLAAHRGGGPFTTARALARLGQRVAFLGCISDDPFGERLRAALTEDGVGVDSVVNSQLPTMLALAALNSDGAADYRFYTEGTAAAALTPEVALAALPEPLDALVGGSLGLMVQPLADATLAQFENDAAASALTVLDPNIRPSLLSDRSSYMHRLERALRRTDVLKASAEDLAWIEPELGLASWLHRGLDRDRLTDLGATVETAEFACLVAAKTCERAGADPPRITL